MIFRSPYPDLAIPDTALTPFALQHAARLVDKPAIIDGPSGRTLTYGELADGIRRTAVGLTARGFGKGDIFATVVPNVPEFAFAFYGVAAAGGATTMLNPLLTVEEQTTQLRDAGARFILTTPERLEPVREAAGRAGVDEVFVIGEAAGATLFTALLERDGPYPAVSIDPAADVAALPYSSGTTGRPKGVMLTHRNLIAYASILEVLEADDTVVAVSPTFHVGGLTNLNTSLYTGATLVLLPRYDFLSFLRLLQDYGATQIAVPPPVVLELARNPVVAEYDLSRLRLIRWGAAPLSDQVARACEERLGCPVRQTYALTEATARTHEAPTTEKRRPGSAGPPLPTTECQIVDVATGAALPPGRTGEICVRGPQVMKGYLNNPEATARTIDKDGWLHTGDLGYADADGWLYVVDRLKELIKYKGYQVAPAELEAVLLAHQAVADAAVIPSPDERAGEVPKAFVVLKTEATAEDLMAFVAARVAPYKKVRRLEFVEQIPKSASGKILRRVLVERERAAMLSLA
jgi:acyl-CoA synthetase (AMP-forming)/AMP-acid ligase II